MFTGLPGGSSGEGPGTTGGCLLVAVIVTVFCGAFIWLLFQLVHLMEVSRVP